MIYRLSTEGLSFLNLSRRTSLALATFLFPALAGGPSNVTLPILLVTQNRPRLLVLELFGVIVVIIGLSGPAALSWKVYDNAARGREPMAKTPHLYRPPMLTNEVRAGGSLGQRPRGLVLSKS